LVYFKSQHWAPKDRKIFAPVEEFVKENAGKIYEDKRQE